MNELRLRTPEGVSFSYPLAGPVSRLLACMIDIAAVGALAQLFSFFTQLLNLVSRDIAIALIIFLYFAVSILYGIIMEYSWRGQTLGKRLLRLRVIDQHGLRLTFPQIAIRNLLRSVDALPFCYLVGGTASLLSPRYQRLGDLAANTVVIRQPRIQEPNLSAITPPLFNSLGAYPLLVNRLRSQVPPKEANLLLEALLRRDEFTPEARLELFEELSSYCQTLAKFPPEALETVTAEQMIRNVIDVIFEKAR